MSSSAIYILDLKGKVGFVCCQLYAKKIVFFWAEGIIVPVELKLS